MGGVTVTSMTESPVVVQPLTASKSACTNVSRPPSTKGSAPARHLYSQM